jgi:hypothetical protein
MIDYLEKESRFNFIARQVGVSALIDCIDELTPARIIAAHLSSLEVYIIKEAEAVASALKGELVCSNCLTVYPDIRVTHRRSTNAIYSHVKFSDGSKGYALKLEPNSTRLAVMQIPVYYSCMVCNEQITGEIPFINLEVYL